MLLVDIIIWISLIASAIMTIYIIIVPIFRLFGADIAIHFDAKSNQQLEARSKKNDEGSIEEKLEFNDENLCGPKSDEELARWLSVIDGVEDASVDMLKVELELLGVQVREKEGR